MSPTRHKAERHTRSRVTITEVAERAGVSIKTVSRVLNRERNVRSATRDKVMHAAQELSYAPHISARRLASQRSFIVALLYRDDDVNHYIPDIQHGALDVCRERGYNLLLHPCVGSIDEVGVEVHDLARHALIDGFIVTPPLADSRSLMSEMKETGVPFVRISQLHRGELSPSISVGDKKGAYAMTQYLASLGHERIGFILGDPSQGASIDRLAGFQEAIHELRLRAQDAWTAQGDFTFESGVRGATAILSSKVRPTAIFASNDDMAAGALLVAHRHGYRVPADLSIVGFDDIAMSQRLWPPLTTIRQPTKSAARAATEMLLNCLDSGDLSPVNEELQSELVVRESAGRPAVQ
jgi:LacI family transcriptional regulator